MKFIKGNFKIEWEWIGEGFNGDYNPGDITDNQLLRFYCYKKIDGKWEEIWETSHCTHVFNGTGREVLEKLTEPIFRALESNEVIDVGGETVELEASRSLRLALEALSWMKAGLN